MPKRSRLFEFSVGVTIIAIVATFLLAALDRIEEEAEKLVVEATVRNIDSGLRLAQAQLITQQRENERPLLLPVNPVAWLDKPPAGYAGEADHVDPGSLATGAWMWDRTNRTLYYRPRRSDGLRVEGGGPCLAWRVAPSGEVVTEASAPMALLRLAAISRYAWRP